MIDLSRRSFIKGVAGAGLALMTPAALLDLAKEDPLIETYLKEKGLIPKAKIYDFKPKKIEKPEIIWQGEPKEYGAIEKRKPIEVVEREPILTRPERGWFFQEIQGISIVNPRAVVTGIEEEIEEIEEIEGEGEGLTASGVQVINTILRYKQQSNIPDCS